MGNSKSWVIKEAKSIPYGHPQRNIRQLLRKVLNTILFRFAYSCPLNSWRVQFHRWRGCHIGKEVYIGRFCFLDNMYPEYIYIYDGVSINANSMILTHFNPFDTFSSVFQAEVKPTIIDNNAIIAVRCTIMPGVHIGQYAVVSAGCIVDHDVKDYHMVQSSSKLRSIDIKSLFPEQ